MWQAICLAIPIARHPGWAGRPVLINELPEYALAFGEFSADLSPASLPAEARQAVIRVFVDSLATMLAGHQDAETVRLGDELLPLGGQAEATLLRAGFPKTDRSLAALLNGMAAGSPEINTGHATTASAHGRGVIPAALAEAEARRASGGELAVAIIAGYEALARVARATTFTRPVQPPGIWPAIASSVGIARLRGGDARRMVAALSVGASLTLNTFRSRTARDATATRLWNGYGSHAGFLGNALIDAGFGVLADAPGEIFANISGDAFDRSVFVKSLGAEFAITAEVRNLDHAAGDSGLDERFHRLVEPVLGRQRSIETLRAARALFEIPDMSAFMSGIARTSAASSISTTRAARTAPPPSSGRSHPGRDYLDELCEFVAQTRYQDIPAEVRRYAKRVLVDDLGAIIRGSAEPEVCALARAQVQCASLRTATLFGTGTCRAGPLEAALINGTAACFVEADGGHWFAPAHGGIYTIPAGLAWAEHIDATAQDFFTAMIVGYDVAARMAAATTLVRPLHPHGIWSTLGAAMAVAKLMNMDAPALKRTLLSAACLTTATSYKNAFEGATVRNVYNGRSNHAGIVAALSARAGFAGLVDGPPLIFGTIAGDAFDHRRVIADLGQRFEITRHYHKCHATDGTIHPGIDAILKIRERNVLAPERLERIEVVTFRQATLRRNPAPTTLLGARYSYPWAIATAVVRGAAGVDDFTLESLGDSSIAALARRVSLTADHEMTRGFPQDRAARVTITFSDGSRDSEFVANPRGGYHDPLTDKELDAKFVNLTGAIVADASALAGVIRACEDETEVRDWTRRIRQQIGER